MIPQIQDDSRKQHEEQSTSPLEEKHSLTPTRHHLSTSDMCSILLAIGLILIVLGKFLGPNTFVGFIILNCGFVVFLSGIAMFVAIVRTTLDV